MGSLAGIAATQDSTDIPAITNAVCVGSGVVANAVASASIPALKGSVAYMSGFQIFAAGATAASVVTVTIAGLAGGTLSFPFVFPAGATTTAQPIAVSFYPAAQASGPNAAITLSVPAGGAGNTAASAQIQGFYVLSQA